MGKIMEVGFGSNGNSGLIAGHCSHCHAAASQQVGMFLWHRMCGHQLISGCAGGCDFASFPFESTRGLIMYRTLVCLFFVAGLSLAPLGCAEKHTATQTSELKTDHGTDTKKVTVEERKTGDLKDNTGNTSSHTTTTTTTEGTPATAPNP